MPGLVASESTILAVTKFHQCPSGSGYYCVSRCISCWRSQYRYEYITSQLRQADRGLKITYTIGHVVKTLAMTENPTKEHSSVKDPRGSGITVVKPKVVTTTICETVRYLKAVDGFWSQWQGWRFAIRYSVAAGAVRIFLNQVLGHPNSLCQPSGVFFLISTIFVATLTSILVAPLHLAWTHSMIVIPSKNGHIVRWPNWMQWKLLLAPSAYIAATEVVGLQVLLVCQNFLGDLVSMDSVRDVVFFGASTTLLLALGLAYYIFFILPAEFALARIEASLLAKGKDGVVSMVSYLDSTVGFWDGWRSFNGGARQRLVKLTFTILAIQSGVVLLGVHLISFEIWATMNKDGFRTVIGAILDLEVRAAMRNDIFTRMDREVYGMDCFGLRVV